MTVTVSSPLAVTDESVPARRSTTPSGACAASPRRRTGPPSRARRTASRQRAAPSRAGPAGRPRGGRRTRRVDQLLDPGQPHRRPFGAPAAHLGHELGVRPAGLAGHRPLRQSGRRGTTIPARPRIAAPGRQVGGQVAGGPAPAQGRRVRAELASRSHSAARSVRRCSSLRDPTAVSAPIDPAVRLRPVVPREENACPAVHESWTRLRVLGPGIREQPRHLRAGGGRQRAVRRDDRRQRLRAGPGHAR